MSRNQNKHLLLLILNKLYLFAMPSLYNMQKSILIQRLGLLFILLVTLSACNKKESSTAKPVQAVDTAIVEIKSEMASQFVIERVQLNDIAVTQRVSGKIEANEQRTTRIGASVTGRITQVMAEVGDRVKAGQALAKLSSPELTNAQLSFLRAVSSSKLAERSVERAQQLVAADVIGFAELQRREVELSVARAELRAASDQLRLIGLSPTTIESLRENGSLASEVAITATQTGIVVERKISQGQVAQPGDPLFTVADLSNVWVVGALPEKNANSVYLNQRVDVEVAAIGNTLLHGKIVFISDTVHPDTRTVAIRTAVNNPKFELKPQMLASLVLKGQTVRQLAVPASAVVRENGREYVFVQLDKLRFRLTEVRLDTAVGDYRPVIKGLDEATPIVVDGTFHLNSQRKRAELE